ncbi:ROK family protein [Paenibacillus sp. USHLN196]|uniref:ROK family protein n=1 Tax=Paenibacillus sp. USHLN196 TaxID=3081291 RepID=UPI003016E4F3
MVDHIINNTMRVKKMNQELVRETLKDMRQGTKSMVAEATGLSIATCRNILHELLSTGELIQLELEESNGGRPAQIYRYNVDFANIACIIIRAGVTLHSLTYSVVNLSGESLEEGSQQLEQMNEEKIYDLVDRLILKYPRIQAIGIGVPGAVHQGVINTCDIPNLINVNLVAPIQEKLEVEVILDNDMNLTVYGLYQRQGYNERNSLVVTTFIEGSLPGAGIMIDGHIHRGNSRFAGEIAFLPLEMSHDEQFRKLHNRDTFHPLAARGVSSLIAVMNPETIALTGDLLKPGDVELIRNECLKYIPELHMPRLILLENPDDDYMCGLIKMTLESLSYSLQLVEKRR